MSGLSGRINECLLLFIFSMALIPAVLEYCKGRKGLNLPSMAPQPVDIEKGVYASNQERLFQSDSYVCMDSQLSD